MKEGSSQKYSEVVNRRDRKWLWRISTRMVTYQTFRSPFQMSPAGRKGLSHGEIRGVNWHWLNLVRHDHLSSCGLAGEVDKGASQNILSYAVA